MPTHPDNHGLNTSTDGSNPRPVGWEGWVATLAFVALFAFLLLKVDGIWRILGVICLVAAFGVLAYIKSYGPLRRRAEPPGSS